MEGYNVVVEDLELVVVLESTEGERRETVASVDVKVTDLGDLRGKPARLHGYRIADVDTMVALGNAHSVALLESSRKPDAFEYVIIEPRGHSPGTVAGHMGNEMNRAVSRGFRLRHRGLFLGFGWHLRLGVIMEKTTHPQTDVEYVVAGAFRTSTLKRQMDDALSRGFSPIAMITPVAAPQFIVFQRPRENC